MEPVTSAKQVKFNGGEGSGAHRRDPKSVIRSMGEGNIFTGICLSTGGGGLPLEGQYASYWNAFLFHFKNFAENLKHLPQ